MKNLTQQQIDHLKTLTRNEPLVREYPWAFEVDLEHWEILPALSLNINLGEVGIKWLCFSLYYTW